MTAILAGVAVLLLALLAVGVAVRVRPVDPKLPKNWRNRGSDED
jgi:hypothetical protein